MELTREGQRLYFAGDTYAAKDRIKSMGGHWDADRRAWWVGVAKEGKARELVAELALRTAPRAAAAAGLDPETPAGIVADRLEETGHAREAAGVRAGRDVEDPDKIRLTGKGTYKGKPYYIGASTRDGSRLRLLTLPDAGGKYLDFWANSTDVEITRRYEVRTRREGFYGRGRQVEVHQTLGGIARFIAGQAAARAEGLPACAACGKRGHLVEDLEDGMMKCPGCADMPGGH